MKNIIPNNVPEWTPIIETMQDTNLQVRETNRLTQMLRNEQRKEIKDFRQEMKEAWQQSQKEYREIRAAINEHIRCINEDRKEFQEWRAGIQMGWEEHDRRMKEAEEKREKNWEAHVLRMEEADLKRKKDLEEYEEKRKKDWEEYDEKRKKGWEEYEEKRKKDWEEHELSMKKIDKKNRELETKLFSTSGHIIEGLMSSSSMKMFQNAGYKVWNKSKNVHRKISNPLQEMEVDVLLDGDTTAIVIEVKANCDPKDIDHLLLQMEKFRALFPALADKTVFVAIAAINYDYNADQYAHEKGLIVVRADSENIFTIDDCDQDALQRF